jgi:hypothetical protein
VIAGTEPAGKVGENQKQRAISGREEMAAETRGLEIVEEKTILFYEDELIAVKLDDGSIYVPVRRLCDNLGVNWAAQYQRIRRDDVLSEAAKAVVITTTTSAPDGRGGGPREVTCLPLDLIPGWLFGIQTSRVNAFRGVVVITTPRTAQQHGDPQEMVCLPLDLVPGWLFGVATASGSCGKPSEAISYPTSRSPRPNRPARSARNTNSERYQEERTWQRKREACKS